jgi:hypothetical protein
MGFTQHRIYHFCNYTRSLLFITNLAQHEACILGKIFLISLGDGEEGGRGAEVA